MKVFISLIFITCVALQAKGLEHGDIDVQGFVFLGNFTSSQSQSRWSYFLSKEKASAPDAMQQCISMFNGRLLTIFTRDEDENIRLLLQIESVTEEYVFTAGKANMLTQSWEWSTTGTPFIYDRFPTPEPTPAANQCVCIVGQLSSYRWDAIPCAGEANFICQF